jgi:hypothetical protein
MRARSELSRLGWPQRLTIDIFRLPAALLPVNLGDLDNLHRLWEREAILRNAALFLDCERFENSDAAHALAIESLDRAGAYPTADRDPRSTPRDRTPARDGGGAQADQSRATPCLAARGGGEKRGVGTGNSTAWFRNSILAPTRFSPLRVR